MYSWNLEKERCEAEAYLTEKQTDFVTTYMTVSSLQFIIEQDLKVIKASTIAALLRVLESKKHASQRQIYFLHKKAADAIGAILAKTSDPNLAEHAKNGLTAILHKKKEKPFRAAAESLGTLPLKIKGPCLEKNQAVKNSLPLIPTVSWRTLMQKSGFPTHLPVESIKWKGRNLIVHSKNPDHVLVVKMSRPEGDPAMLFKEGLWMDFLAGHIADFIDTDDMFRIPEPINFSGSFLFRLDNLPAAIPQNTGIDPLLPAIGFIARSDYFCYPNEHHPNHPFPKETFYGIIARSALLLGRLASFGIIHTAPIPLFHNRVQRHRRNDGGLYEWQRGGRLDQWLDSCRFPNIGKTGIRDFEHFISFNHSPRKLYEWIGSHIFSLVLIAGSYFRNMDDQKKGLRADGYPMDARHLFDKRLFKKTVTKIFSCYYKGFTGKSYTGTLPRYLNQDLDRFVTRLIDEMGIDRHMEEILRVAEQNVMSETDFSEFLTSRGYTAEDIRKMEKGKSDITILTGPHLGGFNQPISIPELIEFTAAAAALCISDRYCQAKLSA